MRTVGAGPSKRDSLSSPIFAPHHLGQQQNPRRGRQQRAAEVEHLFSLPCGPKIIPIKPIEAPGEVGALHMHFVLRVLFKLLWHVKHKYYD